MKTGKGNSLKQETIVLDYDTRSWPRGAAFEFDREALRATYELRRSSGTDEHWFKSQIRLVDSLMLARNDGGGGHVLVRDSRHAESNPGGYLKLQVFSKPGGSLAFGDRNVDLDPGSLFIIDQSRPYRQTMPPGQNLTFFLPHARVNYDPEAIPSVLRFGRLTPECGFLVNAMQMSFRLAGQTSTDVSSLAHALCGSVAGLLDRHASWREGTSAVKAARMDVVRRAINLGLSDPEFGIDDLLKKVAASRATLYRDFAPMGGIMAYIKARRFERAYQVLSMSPRRRGAVSHVARNTGFASLASFSREFRDRFGSAPSEILGQWRTDPEEGPRSGGYSPFAQPDTLGAIYTWPSATTNSGFPSRRSDLLL